MPIIRISIKGGMTIPNIATFDHGTYGKILIHSGINDHIAIAGTWARIESMYIFPIEHGDIPASYVIVYQSVYLFES